MTVPAVTLRHERSMYLAVYDMPCSEARLACCAIRPLSKAAFNRNPCKSWRLAQRAAPFPRAGGWQGGRLQNSAACQQASALGAGGQRASRWQPAA